MDHPRGPRTSGESKPESPALTLVHQISRYGLYHKKKEVLSEKTKRILSTNILTNTTKINPHTRSKIIPL